MGMSKHDVQAVANLAMLRQPNPNKELIEDSRGELCKWNLKERGKTLLEVMSEC